MKRFFSLLIIGTLGVCQHAGAQGGYGSGAGAPMGSAAGHPANTTHNSGQLDQATREYSQPGGPARVTVTIAAQENGQPATNFSASTPRLVASFHTSGTKKGDTIRAVWVSDTSGKKLNETTLKGEQDNFIGSLSLNGPATGWPPGKYELDIYLNNKSAGKTSFTMKASKK